MSMENPFDNINKLKNKELDKIELTDEENNIIDRDVDEADDYTSKDNKKIEARIKNELTLKYLDELASNGLAEKIDYLQRKLEDEDGAGDYEEMDKIRLSPENENFIVKYLPIYGEDGGVAGYQYYRINKDQPIKDTEKDENEKKEERSVHDRLMDAESRYSHELENIWFYKEQEKDREFQENVRLGKMVYIGELSADEIIEAIKSKKLSTKYEETVIFDENKQRLGKNKIYEYVS